MKNKNQTLIILLNWITVICGILTLVLQFNGNVGFENPYIWIMCLLIVSSISTLITHYFNKNK